MLLPLLYSDNLFLASHLKTKATDSDWVKSEGQATLRLTLKLAKWRLCSCHSGDKRRPSNQSCLFTFHQQDSRSLGLYSRKGGIYVFLPTKCFSLRCHLALCHQDSIKVKAELGDLIRVGRPQQVMGQLPRVLTSLEAGGGYLQFFKYFLRL